ncbi:hypothetical protein G6F60_014840 [Rhizopus arrhizus]|nr:hypothetical protein G6F60_014840 [Rhizopus arrhizus]
MPRAAASRQRPADAAARDARIDVRAGPHAPDRSVAGRRRDGAGAAPSAAADRWRHRHPAASMATRWPTRCRNSACACRTGRPISRRSTTPSTARWCRAR